MYRLTCSQASQASVWVSLVRQGYHGQSLVRSSQVRTVHHNVSDGDITFKHLLC